MKLPKLYSKASTGKTRVIEIWTEGDIVISEAGQLGGKMTRSSYKVEPKNVGKANETSPKEQPVLEATSDWNKKKRLKYVENLEDLVDKRFGPMTAKTYEPDKLTFPVMSQPKFNGLRCMVYWEGDELKFMSRGKKFYTTMIHIEEELKNVLPKDIVLDGELYVHGCSLQVINSFVKSLKEDSDRVEYVVYDMMSKEDLSFEDRWKPKFLEGLKTVRVCPTFIANNEKELEAFYEAFIKQKYEGLMIRIPSGKYKWDNRSSDLLKYKKFQDAEFEVIDVIDGKGKFKDAAVFICKNDLTAATFEVTMAVDMETKRAQFESKDKYIGKKLTVKYFDRTDSLIPTFPVGLTFRLEEDLA